MVKDSMNATLKLLKSLIEGGYIGQAIIASIIWGVIGVLYLQGRVVPDTLLIAGSTVLGWYFRSEAQRQADKVAALIGRR